ncbi:MAG: hypothetical protein CM15mP120_08490 [Pseudomonadota bacterium]|nr:MAG: hypothetical protein CM15mP120_08490 [Pseudomonadota bacterium]
MEISENARYINTNTMSLTAQRPLSNAQDMQATAMERLFHRQADQLRSRRLSWFGRLPKKFQLKLMGLTAEKERFCR